MGKYSMKKVLIVEDNLVNARVFSKILTKRGGLEVQHTEDVDEVMKIAQAREADLILMDIFLTNSAYQGRPIDGIKITRMLKTNPQTANLPVILVTAHGAEAIAKTSSNKAEPMTLFLNLSSTINNSSIKSWRFYRRSRQKPKVVTGFYAEHKHNFM